jgi:hypothetical protein
MLRESDARKYPIKIAANPYVEFVGYSTNG